MTPKSNRTSLARKRSWSAPRELTEEEDLRKVYEWLISFHRMVLQNRTVVPWGHRLPCQEIADLLSRFPQDQG